MAVLIVLPVNFPCNSKLANRILTWKWDVDCNHRGLLRLSRWSFFISCSHFHMMLSAFFSSFLLSPKADKTSVPVTVIIVKICCHAYWKCGFITMDNAELSTVHNSVHHVHTYIFVTFPLWIHYIVISVCSMEIELVLRDTWRAYGHVCLLFWWL